MKTKTMVLRHWEDVVFENRNKEYGAYSLRRAYSKRVIAGWGITIALVAALFYVPDLLFSNVGEIIKPLPLHTTTVCVLPPPVMQEKPKIIQQVRQTSSSTSSQIVITKDPVVNTIETTEVNTPATGETGEGGAIDGFVDGTSLEQVVEPVVPAPPVVRDIAEVMPRYDGGTEAMMKFIRKKIRVPASFRYITEGGTVYVRFVVRPDGKVSDVEVIRGLSNDCDKEAMRVISMMPGWIAGMQNGTSVPVRMVLPIKFAHE
ncbi:MAG TPA: TonB family protein [Chryseosolibacter sp.]